MAARSKEARSVWRRQWRGFILGEMAAGIRRIESREEWLLADHKNYIAMSLFTNTYILVHVQYSTHLFFSKF